MIRNITKRPGSQSPAVLSRWISLVGIIALAAVIGLGLAGCGGEDATTPGGDPTPGGGDPTLTGTIIITPVSAETGTELTATYSGSETVTYQWKKGNDNVGTNSNKYTPTEEGSYTVTVSATGYQSKTSAPVIVGPLTKGGIRITDSSFLNYVNHIQYGNLWPYVSVDLRLTPDALLWNSLSGADKTTLKGLFTITGYDVSTWTFSVDAYSFLGGGTIRCVWAAPSDTYAISSDSQVTVTLKTDAVTLETIKGYTNSTVPLVADDPVTVTMTVEARSGG